MFRKRRTLAPLNQARRLDALSADEVQWRDNQVQVAVLLVERYTGQRESMPSLPHLEATIDGWLTDDDSRVDINTLINAVGITWGEHLARDGRLGWVIAADEVGTDLALHGQPGDTIIFPANAVAKRVVAGESHFLQDLHGSLMSSIDELRSRG